MSSMDVMTPGCAVTNASSAAMRACTARPAACTCSDVMGADGASGRLALKSSAAFLMYERKICPKSGIFMARVSYDRNTMRQHKRRRDERPEPEGAERLAHCGLRAGARRPCRARRRETVSRRGGLESRVRLRQHRVEAGQLRGRQICRRILQRGDDALDVGDGRLAQTSDRGHHAFKPSDDLTCGRRTGDAELWQDRSDERQSRLDGNDCGVHVQFPFGDEML